MTNTKITFPILVAASVSLVHLWLNAVALPGLQALSIIHFSLLALVLLVVGPWPESTGAKVWHILSTALPSVSAFYLLCHMQDFYDRGMVFTSLEFAAALITIIGAIEFARRSGWLVAVIIIVFVSYALWWGHLIEGPLRFPGLQFSTVMFRSIFTDDGMFGSIAGISASFVFIFVLFGAFLMRSGGGEFVVDFARVASRRFVGGSGYVAVAASALTGTISGSAVANTVTTGVVTIPLMKRSGFRPAFAAAVEAAASTGGQMMPPVMGAGVFLIASYTQTSYGDIVMVSIIPAILFFFSIALSVRIEAVRERMDAVPVMGDEPSIGEVIRVRGASFLVPVAGVVFMLAFGFSAIWAGVAGIGLVIVTSWFTPTPMGPRNIVLALAEGATNAALTCLLLVSIGLVVNVIAMTGLGATFSLMIVEWAGGNLIVALVLVAVASLVLGMGLPVTAAYVVLATLSAPALAQIVATNELAVSIGTGAVSDSLLPLLTMFDPSGSILGQGTAEVRTWLGTLSPDTLAVLTSTAIDPAVMTGFLVAAHLAVFWLSQDSNVTPPVCLTAYAAATIAGSRPLATGIIAWRIAKSIYVLPVAFFTTPIIDGTLQGALLGGGIALLSLTALLVALEGFLQTHINWIARIMLGVCGIGVLMAQNVDLRVAFAGATILILAGAMVAPKSLRFFFHNPVSRKG